MQILVNLYQWINMSEAITFLQGKDKVIKKYALYVKQKKDREKNEKCNICYLQWK